MCQSQQIILVYTRACGFARVVFGGNDTLNTRSIRLVTLLFDDKINLCLRLVIIIR